MTEWRFCKPIQFSGWNYDGNSGASRCERERERVRPSWFSPWLPCLAGRPSSPRKDARPTRSPPTSTARSCLRPHRCSGGRSDRVGPAADAGQPFHRHADAAGLPPDRRPGGPRHRRHPRPAAGEHRPAVLHLPRPRRSPRPTTCPEGVHREVQGNVRPGLGQGPRRDLRAAEEARHHPERRRATAGESRRPGVGRSDRQTRRRSTAGCRRSSPASSITRIITWAGCSLRSTRWESATTRL